ncbi:MAG: CPBP family intramembrane metalloprotease [Ruminococcus sp.]|nr:CPBP family intramembrane metalloprotease [Ruminococcus sp.]MCM1382782.1 CPBP family intramembrane metalloprotease [Muribaculaceae bacterium]
MKKLYEKNELWFAILWIIVYCVVTIPIRGELGDGSPVMFIALAVIAAGILFFVKKNKLEEKYGLVKWKGAAKDYLFFIPMFVLMTGNLWGGVQLNYHGFELVFAVLSMLLIGFTEEMLFRGFLFRILLKKDPAPVAIAISAVTFGIGHIVNLFAGQANMETVVQVLFAIAWGFIFTFVFYKSGSLLVCICVHGLVDSFARFSTYEENIEMSYVYMFATIIIAIIYCIYLSRKPTVLEKEWQKNSD